MLNYVVITIKNQGKAMRAIYPEGFIGIPKISDASMDLFGLRGVWRVEPNLPKDLEKFVSCETTDAVFLGYPINDPPLIRYELNKNNFLVDFICPKILSGSLSTYGVIKSSGSLIAIPAPWWLRIMLHGGKYMAPFEIAAAGGDIETISAAKAPEAVCPFVTLHDLAVLLGALNPPPQSTLPEYMVENAPAIKRGGASRKIDIDAFWIEFVLWAESNNLGDNNPDWRPDLKMHMIKWMEDQTDYPGLSSGSLDHKLRAIQKALETRKISSK